MERADFFWLEPFDISQFTRVLVQIGQHFLFAAGSDFSHDPDTERNPHEAVAGIDVVDLGLVCGGQVPAAGYCVQTSSLVGTFRPPNAVRANVPLLNEPDSNARDVRTFKDAFDQ